MLILFSVLGIFFGAIIAISVVVGVTENSGIKGVCARCGSLKRKLLEACQSCGFKPTSQQDIAKQFMLSTREHHVGNIFPGKAPSELRRIGQRIQGGTAYKFDQTQLSQVLKNL